MVIIIVCDHLIQLAFAFNLCYVQKLKLREVKKFARITQLTSSRATIQTWSVWPQSPSSVHCHPAQIATSLWQFRGDKRARPVILGGAAYQMGVVPPAHSLAVTAEVSQPVSIWHFEEVQPQAENQG